MIDVRRMRNPAFALETVNLGCVNRARLKLLAPNVLNCERIAVRDRLAVDHRRFGENGLVSHGLFPFPDALAIGDQSGSISRGCGLLFQFLQFLVGTTRHLAGAVQRAVGCGGFACRHFHGSFHAGDSSRQLDWVLDLREFGALGFALAERVEEQRRIGCGFDHHGLLNHVERAGGGVDHVVTIIEGERGLLLLERAKILLPCLVRLAVLLLLRFLTERLARLRDP
jgi:hypothetical protein